MSSPNIAMKLWRTKRCTVVRSILRSWISRKTLATLAAASRHGDEVVAEDRLGWLGEHVTPAPRIASAAHRS
jgi:hypothetical protein